MSAPPTAALSETATPVSADPVSAAGFASLAALVRARSGLALGEDKIYLLESRLGPLMRRERLAGLDALAVRLRQPAQEHLADAVVDALTTNETLFFRDTHPFAHVRERALPRLHAARQPGQGLRIWSAAAATGQEAYSLAMIVAELAALLGSRRVEIIATDIARAPLARAAAGLYSQFEVQRGLPIQMLMRHFAREDEGWRIKPALRAMVRFEQRNLLGDLRPLGTFDLVFCRNVLIYFDAPTKARALEAITAQMAPDALLYLGGAETTIGLTDRLVPVPEAHGIHALRR
ncbi:MAG TPA: protein-glutamate O-methyltransferase CheR [Acetobacteraceae bacterium]|nr:protein-glutamate O-methyltransferase CheR [Acetobacteraceae bacterium]